MADGIELKVNLPDFKAQLQAFGADFERKTIRAAVAAAGGVFKKLVLDAVPVLRPTAGRAGPTNKRGARIAGNLKRSIYLARAKNVSRGTEHYVVSFKKKRTAQDPFYGRFLEAGWIPRGRGSRRKGGTRFRAVSRANDSGQKITKYAFLVPAFVKGKEAALSAFNARIQQRINKENARRGRAVSGSGE